MLPQIQLLQKCCWAFHWHRVSNIIGCFIQIKFCFHQSSEIVFIWNIFHDIPNWFQWYSAFFYCFDLQYFHNLLFLSADLHQHKHFFDLKIITWRNVFCFRFSKIIDFSEILDATFNAALDDFLALHFFIFVTSAFMVLTFLPLFFCWLFFVVLLPLMLQNCCWTLCHEQKLFMR